MSDWSAQVESDATASAESDWLDEAAQALWKAISERGVPYAQALEEIEKRMLETAMNVPGPRRELAERLQTSERTLYYKMRAHGLTALSR
jgi:DNA-binding NtrC family response regulator